MTWSVVPGFIKGLEGDVVVKTLVAAILLGVCVQDDAIADHRSRNSDNRKQMIRHRGDGVAQIGRVLGSRSKGTEIRIPPGAQEHYVVSFSESKMLC